MLYGLQSSFKYNNPIRSRMRMLTILIILCSVAPFISICLHLLPFARKKRWLTSSLIRTNSSEFQHLNVCVDLVLFLMCLCTFFFIYFSFPIKNQNRKKVHILLIAITSYINRLTVHKEVFDVLICSIPTYFPVFNSYKIS